MALGRRRSWRDKPALGRGRDSRTMKGTRVQAPAKDNDDLHPSQSYSGKLRKTRKRTIAQRPDAECQQCVRAEEKRRSWERNEERICLVDVGVSGKT